VSTPGYPLRVAELRPENRATLKDEPKDHCPRCGCMGKGHCPKCVRDQEIITGSLRKFPPRRGA